MWEGGSPERPSSPSPSHPSLRSYNNYFPFSSAVVCSNLPPISEQFSGAFEPPPPPPSFLERAGARRRGSLRRGIAGREGGGEGRAVGKTAGAPKTSSSLLLSLLYLFCALFKAFRIRQFSAHPHLSFIPKPKCTKQWRQTFQSLIATYLRPAADCCSRKQDEARVGGGEGKRRLRPPPLLPSERSLSLRRRRRRGRREGEGGEGFPRLCYCFSFFGCGRGRPRPTRRI